MAEWVYEIRGVDQEGAVVYERFRSADRSSLPFDMQRNRDEFETRALVSFVREHPGTDPISLSWVYAKVARDD